MSDEEGKGRRLTVTGKEFRVKDFFFPKWCYQNLFVTDEKEP